MKTKIVFVERKFQEFVSIEKVFRQIAKNLSKENFDSVFRQMPFGNNLTGLIKNLLFFRRPPSEIYHITGHIHYMALVLPKKKTVLTIHDLGFLKTRNGLRRFILKKLFLDLPLKKAGYITAVSDATKREIAFYTNCESDKIRVIENPLHDILTTCERKSFQTICPNILQVGTGANKNVINLVKALKDIVCRLVIIGKLDDKLMTALEENKIHFENKFGLTDAEMKNEYQKADIVVFCSTFEGFGLPVIEGQAMGTPVVTSDISPLREVAGGAAQFVQPDDVMSIRNGILKVLNDEEYRQSLIESGIVNVRRFDARQVASQYEDLYKEVIKANLKN